MKWKTLAVAAVAAMAPLVSADDLYTHVYVVPPTFLNGPAEQGWQSRDPYARVRPPAPAKTARQVLEEAGIGFTEGATAIYKPSTSQLVVRNTQDQLELVEAYIESITARVEKQIYLTFREVILPKGSHEKFGEWLFPDPTEPDGKEARTGGSRTRAFRSYESFFEELAGKPREIEAGDTPRREVAGVLTDPQFQVLIRKLSKEKEIDMMTAPSVMARSGQPVLSQLEERRYGVIATMGGDGFTIDLQVFLPPVGEALFESGDELSTPYRLTIWDGQTVVLSEPLPDGDQRVVFTRTQLVDPAGIPIRQNDSRKSEKPEGESDSEASEEEPRSKKPVEFEPEKPAGGPGASVSPIGEVEALTVQQADHLALRGSQLLAEAKFEEASEFFVEAVRILPEHPFTEARRRAFRVRLRQAEEELREEEAPLGAESFHVHRVDPGETVYEIARHYQTSPAVVLRLNRLEDTRIDVGQLLIVPIPLPQWDETSGEPLEGVLKRLVLQRIDFRDLPFEEALGQIHAEILDENDTGLFPGALPRMLIDEEIGNGSTKITLKLSNVPAAEALRYLTALANCRYSTRGNVIYIHPQGKDPDGVDLEPAPLEAGGRKDQGSSGGK